MVKPRNNAKHHWHFPIYFPQARLHAAIAWSSLHDRCAANASASNLATVPSVRAGYSEYSPSRMVILGFDPSPGLFISPHDATNNIQAFFVFAVWHLEFGWRQGTLVTPMVMVQTISAIKIAIYGRIVRSLPIYTYIYIFIDIDRLILVIIVSSSY